MCTRPLHRSWRAAAPRDTMWEGSSVALVPASRSPLLLGRRRRAQGWQQIRTMMLLCSWSPWLCSGSLHPHSCAHCNPGRAGITLLCLSETVTQCPRSHVGCRPCLAGHIQKSKSITPHARQPQTCWHLLTGCSPPTVAIWESGVPLRWRSAACPWSSPSGWALPCSPLSGTVASTPRATSCGSACPRSRTPAG